MTLEKNIARSWSKETSSNPQEWSLSNPSYGQCAVTSLVVQDYRGGNILNLEVYVKNHIVSHYYNLIDDEIVDLTKEQFDNSILDYSQGKEKKKSFASTREYILSYPQTRIRYEILKENVRVSCNDNSSKR